MMPLLLADEARQFPETRPDSEAETHRAVCHCEVCKRPGSMLLKKRYLYNTLRKKETPFVTPAMPARGRRPRSHHPPTA